MRADIPVHKPITTQYGKVTYYRKPRPWTPQAVRKLMARVGIAEQSSVGISIHKELFDFLEAAAKDRATAAGKPNIIPVNWDYGREWINEVLEEMIGAVGFAWETTQDSAALHAYMEI